MSEELSTEFYFPCGVYSIKKPNFLFAVKDVAEECLSKVENVANELSDKMKRIGEAFE